jgi:hypothetical protein
LADAIKKQPLDEALEHCVELVLAHQTYGSKVQFSNSIRYFFGKQ